jgi:hypothetical protein
LFFEFILLLAFAIEAKQVVPIDGEEWVLEDVLHKPIILRPQINKAEDFVQMHQGDTAIDGVLLDFHLEIIEAHVLE